MRDFIKPDAAASGEAWLTWGTPGCCGAAVLEARRRARLKGRLRVREHLPRVLRDRRPGAGGGLLPGGFGEAEALQTHKRVLWTVPEAQPALKVVARRRP